MRNASHRPLAILAIAGALVLAATAPAAPVLAKEGLAAELDAPVAGGTPGGTKLLIGMTVTVLDEGTKHLVDGSPLYVRLIGPDGAATRALAQQGAPGHYTARVEVPASGVADIEVGIDGSTDMPLGITGTAIVPGAITARTAQVAPLVTPITPLAHASAAAPPVAASAGRGSAGRLAHPAGRHRVGRTAPARGGPRGPDPAHRRRGRREPPIQVPVGRAAPGVRPRW